eukprot:gnl/Ergobibamus_cyprinoides/2101.p3 GENE.gnl/Ergobibamus_cyprinoides/2101~~gnl/Ergobibamus_cyprinoides/2101.p3  ORF type:complete len:136 (+),score=70.66 gnl/Ergobibamus_cyprinoides/2101:62-469(+)
MSETTPVAVAVEAPVAVALTPMEACKQVIAAATAVDGVVRGLRQVVQALDRKEAVLCLLAEDCDNASYTKLVKALCTEHGIAIMEVPTRQELGIMAGLCRYDAEGEARSVVATSSIALTKWGVSSEALSFLQAGL